MRRLRLGMGGGFVDGVEDGSGDGFDNRARCTATRGGQGGLYGAVVGVQGQGSHRAPSAHCRVT